MSRSFALLSILVIAAPAVADDEFFEKKIRPVLVTHCYSCHSNDAKKLKAHLKLDSHDAILKGGDTGPAVVAGSPEKSLLVKAIEYDDVDLRMPPKGKLPADAIADLRKWIKDGAKWPGGGGKDVVEVEFDLKKRKAEHWAWQPIQAIPANIDKLINQKLAEKGLEPAPAAPPRAILRRLSFDIVGLPPTPEAVRDFEKAYAGDAKKAVRDAAEKLLASPQFGERWGRHWLDLVRYGESRGHEFDYNLPNAYQYRDYVIRALNADVPYDQFTREHIAGDLLAKPRLNSKDAFNESILGTGFWFLGEQVHSPVDICQDRAERMDNQLDVMTKTFLGLTVSCARCHDHKFDAISTKDYYALAGFLESSSYRLVPFETMEYNRRESLAYWKKGWQSGQYTKEQAERGQAALVGLEDYLEEARAAIQKNASAVPQDRKAKLDGVRVGRWIDHLKSAVADRSDPLHRFACGVLDARERPELEPIKSTKVIVDYRECSPEVWLPDGFAYGPGPVQIGMNDRGRFAVEAFAEFDPHWSETTIKGAENEPGPVGRLVRSGKTIRTPKFDVGDEQIQIRMRGSAMVYAAVEGHVMISGPLHGALVRTLNSGRDFRWHTLDLRVYKGRRVHLEFTPDGKEFALAKVVEGPAPPVDSELDAPRELVEWQGEKKPASLPQQAARIRSHLAVALAAMTKPSPAPIDAHRANWFFTHEPLFRAAPSKDKDAIRGAVILPDLRMQSKLAPAILDGNAVDERVFIRGNYKTPGEIAPRRLLEALVGDAPIKSDHGSGRLELANQIVDPKTNPFFTRVFVNRVWHHLMGRGIVGSVDNFGVLGERPTHPELLDALADEFAKDGYSLKRLIERIVMSDAYQRSSRPSDAAAKADAGNLLLQHARVRRLEGEAIRDSLLAVSGRLDPAMYGPSVPVHLTDFQQGRGRPASGPIDGNGRRSIYLAVRRNFLSSFLLAFDTPIPFSTVGRRTVSNVPAQALILLNDPFVHQQSGLWAKRVLAEKGSSEERIASMYLTAYGRSPSDAELAACREFVAANDEAAWAALAHVLVNAKEFIYLD